MKAIKEITWQEITTDKTIKNIKQYLKNLHYFMYEEQNFLEEVARFQKLDAVSLEEKFNNFARVNDDSYFLNILLDTLNQLACIPTVMKNNALIKKVDEIRQLFLQTESNNSKQVIVYLKRDLHILFYGLHKNKISSIDFFDWLAIYKHFLDEKNFEFLLEKVNQLLLDGKSISNHVIIVNKLWSLYQLSSNFSVKDVAPVIKTNSLLGHWVLRILCLLYFVNIVLSQQSMGNSQPQSFYHYQNDIKNLLDRCAYKNLISQMMDDSPNIIVVEKEQLEMLDGLAYNEKCKRELIKQFTLALHNGNAWDAAKNFYLSCYIDPTLANDFVYLILDYHSTILEDYPLFDQLLEDKSSIKDYYKSITLKEARLKYIRSQSVFQFEKVTFLANDLLKIQPLNEVALESLAFISYLSYTSNYDKGAILILQKCAETLEPMTIQEAETYAILAGYYYLKVTHSSDSFAILNNLMAKADAYFAQSKRKEELRNRKLPKTYAPIIKAKNDAQAKIKEITQQTQTGVEKKLVDASYDSENFFTNFRIIYQIIISLASILTTSFLIYKSLTNNKKKKQEEDESKQSDTFLINALNKFTSSFFSAKWINQNSVISLDLEKINYTSDSYQDKVMISEQEARQLFIDALKSVFGEESITLKDNVVILTGCIASEKQLVNDLKKKKIQLREQLLRTSANNCEPEKSISELFEELRKRLHALEKNFKEATNKMPAAKLALIYDTVLPYSHLKNKNEDAVSKRALSVLSTYRSLQMLIDHEISVSKICFNMQRFADMLEEINETESKLSKNPNLKLNLIGSEEKQLEFSQKIKILSDKIDKLDEIKILKYTYEKLDNSYDAFLTAKSKIKESQEKQRRNLDNKLKQINVKAKDKQPMVYGKQEEVVSVARKKVEKIQSATIRKQLSKEVSNKNINVDKTKLKKDENERWSIKKDIRVTFANDCLDLVQNCIFAQDKKSSLFSACKEYCKSNEIEANHATVQTVIDLALRYLIMRSSHAVGQLTNIYNANLIDSEYVYRIRDNIMHRSYLAEDRTKDFLAYASSYLNAFSPLRDLKKKGTCAYINTKELPDFPSQLDKEKDVIKYQKEACLSYLHLLGTRMEFLRQIAGLIREKGGYVLYAHNGVLLAAMRFCITAIGQRLRDLKKIDKEMYFSIKTDLKIDEFKTVNFQEKEVDIFSFTRWQIAHMFSAEDRLNEATNKIVVTKQFLGSERFLFEELEPNQLLLIFSKAETFTNIISAYLPVLPIFKNKKSGTEILGFFPKKDDDENRNPYPKDQDFGIVKSMNT